MPTISRNDCWAHSEYIKLLRSLHDNAVWDMPPQTIERYLKTAKTAEFQIWTTNHRRGWLALGKKLRVELAGPARVEWTIDGRSKMTHTDDSGLHLHTAMLPVSTAAAGTEIAVKVTPDDEDLNILKADSFVIRIRPGL